jgi:fatty acid synthase
VKNILFFNDSNVKFVLILLLDESILIHSGCGGIGQAAISVCQYYNCNIFTTVGNEKKKQFLIKEYNIPEDHIFSSRDTQFESKIMSITLGKGVDLVLNSLTQEKLESSFRCVATNGRFVEIGKYDFQMNKQLGTFAFLRNISFFGVDIKIWFESTKPNSLQEFYKWIHENSSNGCVKPTNRTVFQPSEVQTAFRYMTTGKHIGKFLIKFRDEENSITAREKFNSALKINVNVKTYFNPQKVYIITGGLGGMALELLHWMIINGAKKIFLTSRTGIKFNYQKFILNRFKGWAKIYDVFKTKIIVWTHESKTIKGSEKLLEDASQLGPIGGIFHLAVALNLNLISDQTVKSFRETCESKIDIFSNLDKLTRISCPELDYFVVFSSVICGKGFAGQSNYAYANSVCERICEQRRRDGLHGLAIQWGAVGDVGLVADNAIFDNFPLSHKQSMNSCLEVMDKFLQYPDSILSSNVNMD